LLTAAFSIFVLAASGRAANWISPTGGFWQTSANWDHIPDSTQICRVTNAASKTVIIDATTVATSPTTMTIQKLELWAPTDTATTNTLAITNAGTATPLTVATSVVVSNGGLLRLTNSVVQITPATGTDFTIHGGGVILDSGSLLANSVTCFVGHVSSGTLTVNGGQFQAGALRVGDLAGSHGTLTIAGGTVNAAVLLRLGNDLGATGTVWVTSGQLMLTNLNSTRIGDSGVGQMTVSNGTLQAGEIRVGNGDATTFPAAVGTLTIAGGTANISSNLTAGRFTNSVGAIWMNGGTLTVTNAVNKIIVGADGTGSMTLSNGTILTTGIIVGRANSALGTFTMAGGNLTVDAPGSVAALDVCRGTFAFSNGVVSADNLVITNVAGRFAFAQGTFDSVGTAVTNGQRFTIGNGLSVATFHLLGGVHSFANNLYVRTNATLSGCGTVTGNVLVEGTVLADCGGILTFTGSVTNNSLLRAANGSVIEAFGPVINNGVIDLLGGTTNFHSTFINNGVVLTSNSIPLIVSMVASGGSVRVNFTTSLAASYAVDYKPDLATNTWSILTNVTGSGGVMAVTDPGATAQSKRFYRARLIVPP
jgi:T5SS/PEP-CTERM-associated repeat protein